LKVQGRKDLKYKEERIESTREKGFKVQGIKIESTRQRGFKVKGRKNLKYKGERI